MKILLTGANGQVGFECQCSLALIGEVIALDRQGLDLTDQTEIERVIQQHKPDIIVNAAAYTAVDKAEQQTELAYSINATAPQIMAEQAKLLNIPLIHYSTDYVFNGQGQKPWSEQDPTNPINVYGQTKLAGEQAIQASGCNYVILRTSWVYGARGQNFLNTMQRLATTLEQLSVVDDQIGTPTWSRHIADATAQIIGQAKSSQNPHQFWRQNSGVYHLTASGKTSWHGFTRAIFDNMEQQGTTTAMLKAIPTSEYPTPAKRPLYSCMNNQKLADTFGIRLLDWQASLALVLFSINK
ncbi:MAG: dTDP-4-dehydrorhamnose reductase [Methylophaga sp.]|nr:MAG: dTDP-4-dehydrorhamnose reductase [Methylophaga sp.]